MTTCQPNNIDSTKDIEHSLETFSSLSELISHNTESINSDIMKASSQSDINAQPFSSLAALTADYLQKSNATNNIESQERCQSSIFVIPKLSIKKKETNEKTRNIQLPFNNENSKRQLVSTNILGKHEIDLLQKDFSNMDIFPKSNIVKSVKSENQLKDPINIVNEICTSSSDDWVDLSTALKEAEFLTDSAFCNANLTTSRKLYHDTHNLEIYLEDDNRVTPNVLPVTLNLCALRFVKLPYTKRNVSVFGKTLCKKWKIKRPILEVIVQQYNTIKPFDFSTPYKHFNPS